MGRNELFRCLPPVDELLQKRELEPLSQKHPQAVVKAALQDCLQGMREEIKKGKWKEETLIEFWKGSHWAQRVEEHLSKWDASRRSRAINATGVILHTGLGRAVLPEAAERAAAEVGGYSVLEVDPVSGGRGVRDRAIERQFQLLMSCEAAAVVNNNAAATLLAVNSFAKGQEAIVSRGELVEIGGSYRMPDVMEAGGAKMVEVGTTNRTRIEDYEKAITDRTGLILKVHTSNYRVEGFTEAVSVKDLVSLGNKHNIPVVHDLGSGLLLQSEVSGLSKEPRVQESLSAGVDLVTFSGDKLFGGPQAGILLGKQTAMETIRKNPMFRAVRLGKQILAALESTLSIYLEGEDAVIQKIPTMGMLQKGESSLREIAQGFVDQIRAIGDDFYHVEVTKGFSEVGSGSAPGVQIPSHLVSIQHRSHGPRGLSEVASPLQSFDFHQDCGPEGLFGYEDSFPGGSGRNPPGVRSNQEHRPSLRA